MPNWLDYSNLLIGAKSHYRGWPCEWTGDAWLYSDTKQPLPGWGGQTRPCKKCGAMMNDHESDKCLGNLPGVDNACCGHGVKDDAYIRFTNGVTVIGFDEIMYPVKECACE